MTARVVTHGGATGDRAVAQHGRSAAGRDSQSTPVRQACLGVLQAGVGVLLPLESRLTVAVSTVAAPSSSVTAVVSPGSRMPSKWATGVASAGRSTAGRAASAGSAG